MLVAVPGIAATENGVEKVAILPFDTTSAGKYEALKDGLKSMISGRLASRKKIVVVPVASSSADRQLLIDGYPEKTASLFQKIGADFVGAGRMAIMDGKLQLQVTFYSVKGTPPIEVSVEAEGDQQILPAVEILVLRIEEQVLGLKNELSVADLEASQKKGTEGFMTEHPDRQYKEEIVTGAAVSAEDGGIAIARGDLLRRKSLLEDGIVSLAVEDLDGDGSDEIFIVSDKNLKVMHYDRGLLKQLGVYDFSESLEVHAINIADLDGDDRSEIYLSAVANDRFSSVILGWSAQSGFRVIREQIRYGIRPLNLPDGSSFLVGQAQTIRGEKFLRPGVFVLDQKENGAGFTRGKRMFLPEGINLFDFVIADLDNDGLVEKVAITRDLKLVVYDANNNLLWRSTTDFGGGVNYLGSRWQEEVNKATGPGDVNKDGFTNADLYYLPVRLIARDGNNDGNVDLIVAKNELSTFKVLKNLRSFKTGKVVCMNWNGSSMQEVWTTDTMDGYVADFHFTNEFGDTSMLTDSQPSDNSEKVRLVVGQVAASGLENLLPFGEAPSNLVVYEFKISAQPSGLPGTE